MVNDTISDMLTRIRNANVASKTCVSIPKTKVHINICLLYTSPSPRDLSTSRMPSSA